MNDKSSNQVLDRLERFIEARNRSLCGIVPDEVLPLLVVVRDEIERLRKALQKIVTMRGPGGDLALATLYFPRISPDEIT